MEKDIDYILLFSHSVLSDSFVIPWTVVHQAPLSRRFPRQEYWSRLPFLLQNGVGCHALLRGIIPVQGLNLHLLCLLHCRQILYHRATGEALYNI